MQHNTTSTALKRCGSVNFIFAALFLRFQPNGVISYDFNPIELVFHLAKRLMRQRYNYTDSAGIGEAGGGILREQFLESLYDCVTDALRLLRTTRNPWLSMQTALSQSIISFEFIVSPSFVCSSPSRVAAMHWSH